MFLVPDYLYILNYFGFQCSCSLIYCLCVCVCVNFQGHHSFGVEAAPDVHVDGMHSFSSRLPREHVEYSQLSTIPEEVSIADFLFNNISNKKNCQCQQLGNSCTSGIHLSDGASEDKCIHKLFILEYIGL